MKAQKRPTLREVNAAMKRLAHILTAEEIRAMTRAEYNEAIEHLVNAAREGKTS